MFNLLCSMYNTYNKCFLVPCLCHWEGYTILVQMFGLDNENSDKRINERVINFCSIYTYGRRSTFLNT